MDRFLESVKSLDIASLENLLDSDPSLLGRPVYSPPCRLFREVGIPVDVNLGQSLYFFCFEQLDRPEQCENIIRISEVLERRSVMHKYSYHIPLARGKNWYLLLRKIFSLSRECDGKFAAQYLLLSSHVRNRLKSWFDSLPVPQHWESEQWVIDLLISLEFSRHEVEFLLRKKEKDDMANCFLAYPFLASTPTPVGKWKIFCLYSGVLYQAIKDSLKESGLIADLLLSESSVMASYVAPLVLFYAAAQDDLSFMTKLVEKYGPGIVDRRPNGGRTCYQLSLLGIEEYVSPQDIRSRILYALDQSRKVYRTVYRQGSIPSFDQLKTVSNDILAQTLTLGEYSRVSTASGDTPLLEAFISDSSVSCDYKRFCMLKDYLKGNNPQVMNDVDFLVKVILKTDADFLLNFLLDDDIRDSFGNLGDKDIFPNWMQPHYILRHFNERVGQDEKFTRCLEPLLALFAGNIALFLDVLNLDAERTMSDNTRRDYVDIIQESIFEKFVKWCSETINWMVQFADAISDKNENVDHLRRIFDHFSANDRELLGSTNDLGMNLLMYLANGTTECHPDIIKHVLDSRVFDINKVVEVDFSKLSKFDLQHGLGVPLSGNKVKNTKLMKTESSIELKRLKMSKDFPTGPFKSFISKKFKEQGQEKYMSKCKVRLKATNSSDPSTSRIIVSARMGAASNAAAAAAADTCS